MEGMGIKLTPVIGRHLLRHLCMFGPMAGKIRSHICNLSTYQLQKPSYNLASDLTNIQKFLWVKIFINLHNWIYYLFMYRETITKFHPENILDQVSDQYNHALYARQ